MGRDSDGQHYDRDQQPAVNNGQRTRLHDPRSRTPLSYDEAVRTGHDGRVNPPARGADISTEDAGGQERRREDLERRGR